MFRLAIIVLPLLAASFPSFGDDIAAGISRDKVEINSSYSGTEVVVFGAIENESGELPAASEKRDIVVVLRSDRPARAIVRKKERFGPLWVNRSAQSFAEVPSFYFLASTRPLKNIASDDVLAQFELGLERIAVGPVPGVIGGDKEFKDAMLRERVQAELYAQHEGAVSFLSGSLFRTTVSLPPNVPAGHLRVAVYAFANGQVTSSNSMTLFIDKTGIERQLSEFADYWPWAYGLLAVLISAAAGWLAAVAFRERQ